MENNLLIKNINDLEEYLRIYKELQAMIKNCVSKGTDGAYYMLETKRQADWVPVVLLYS